MRHWAAWVLHHRKLVVIVFSLLLLGSLALFPLVRTNFDLSEYLAPTSPSTIALNDMRADFTEAIPDVQLMMPDLSVGEALALKARLEAMPEVRSVMWLDDVADVRVPVEMLDRKVVEGFYKERTAFYRIVSNADMSQLDVLKALQNVAGEEGAVAGNLVDLAKAQSSVASEMGRIVAFSVPLALVILLLTSHSWFEPILLLASIFIAVGINMGTNVVFGSVSFITQSISAVLQMAVSLDYAVFLLHRFGEERKKGRELLEALEIAMRRSASSILSSALTTVFGFLALCFMRFQLGPDLGMVLAKGVFFSLATSLLLLPVLIVFTHKLIEKSSHRSFLPAFHHLSAAVYRGRIVLPILVLLIAAPSFFAQQRNHFLYGTGSYPAESRENLDRDRMTARFGETASMVLLIPKGDMGKEEALIQRIRELPSVNSVSGYVTEVGISVPEDVLPQEQIAPLVSERFHRYFVIAKSPREGVAGYRLAEELRGISEASYPTTDGTGGAEWVGQNFSLLDMRDTIRRDNFVVNGLAILAVGLVILLNFRSLILPLILLLTIESAIWINLAFPYFQETSLNYIGYLVISTVQLGSTVDYAILMTQNYMDRRKRQGKRTSMLGCILDSAGSVIPPALILSSVGFILGWVSTNAIVSELGRVLGRGALLTLLLVLVFLPPLLLHFDGLIRRLSFRTGFCKRSREQDTEEMLALRAWRKPRAAEASATVLPAADIPGADRSADDCSDEKE